MIPSKCEMAFDRSSLVLSLTTFFSKTLHFTVTGIKFEEENDLQGAKSLKMDLDTSIVVFSL